MRPLTSLVAVLSAASLLCNALPLSLEKRAVSPDDLERFNFWVQYAASAYCPRNYDGQTGGKLTCPAGNCPLVERDDTTIVFEFSNSTITDTAGFVAVDRTMKTIVVAIRGSHSIRNWIADAAFTHMDTNLCKGCFAETGFWTAWQDVRTLIVDQVKTLTAEYPNYELVIVGHSLGAAVATLAAADFRTQGHPATMYAYGSPRVGNPALAKYITDQGGNYRFSHQNDPVPKLPLLAMGYVHVSPEYYITSPTNVSVSADDIEVLDGEVNFAGNTGTGAPNITDIPQHNWYFEQVNACKGPGMPW